MRKWQPLLEFLLHHAPKVSPLCWSFCLGRLEGLSSRVCRFLLMWPWSAEDRVVLGSISWQSGFSLFFLGHFFLLSMGHGPDMKWVGVPRSFGPTIVPQNPVVRLLGWRWGFWCPRGLCMGFKREPSASLLDLIEGQPGKDAPGKSQPKLPPPPFKPQSPRPGHQPPHHSHPNFPLLFSPPTQKGRGLPKGKKLRMGGDPTLLRRRTRPDELQSN